MSFLLGGGGGGMGIGFHQSKVQKSFALYLACLGLAYLAWL